jgi:hypothetical protein
LLFLVTMSNLVKSKSMAKTERELKHEIEEVTGRLLAQERAPARQDPLGEGAVLPWVHRVEAVVAGGVRTCLSSGGVSRGDASRAVEGSVDWDAARVIWERAQGQLRKYVNGQLYGWYDERGLWWYATGTAVRASRW